jgi:hypothetical protein
MNQNRSQINPSPPVKFNRRTKLNQQKRNPPPHRQRVWGCGCLLAGLQPRYVLVVHLGRSLQVAQLGVAVGYGAVRLRAAGVLARLPGQLQDLGVLPHCFPVFPLPLQRCT